MNRYVFLCRWPGASAPGKPRAGHGRGAARVAARAVAAAGLAVGGLASAAADADLSRFPPPTMDLQGDASVLRPRGLGARIVEEMVWSPMYTMAAIVFVLVLLLLAIALVMSRRSPDKRALFNGERFVLVAGALIPTLILVGVFFITMLGMQAFTEANDRREAVTVDVIGHRWWWEFRYPDYGVVTANEMFIPAGRIVRLRVTSADVIHSFWVPSLQGKIDNIPGQVNTFWLQADEIGSFWGACAEFCGIQHAKMELHVRAVSETAFAAWLDRQAEPAFLPESRLARLGKEVFFQEGCANCHAIRGTEADGDLGPDLTHLASRKMLGAGVLVNNRGNLAGWVVNAQAHKPGIHMPPMYLNGEELEALLAYLEGLL